MNDTRILEEKLKDAHEYIESYKEEMERLNEEKESWKRVATKNFNEAEDYKAIIKEVRELADKYEMGKYDYSVPCFELKEILDKEKE